MAVNAKRHRGIGVVKPRADCRHRDASLQQQRSESVPQVQHLTAILVNPNLLLTRLNDEAHQEIDRRNQASVGPLVTIEFGVAH